MRTMPPLMICDSCRDDAIGCANCKGGDCACPCNSVGQPEDALMVLALSEGPPKCDCACHVDLSVKGPCGCCPWGAS